MGEAAFRAIVRGRVQGVYYRAFARQRAVRLGIRGYVRNLPDGSVEVYAEGQDAGLGSLLEALKRGPPGARVDSIDTTRLDSTGQYRDFAVKG